MLNHGVPRRSRDAAADDRAVRRLIRIATQLVDGPRSLIPPPELDDHGWLEPDFRLVWRRGRHQESVIVFFDNTVNRDSDFLAPVMRYARWDYKPDRSRPTAPWPRMEIQLARVEERRARVDALIRQMERALGRAPLVPMGLAAARETPGLPVDEARGYLKIERRNGDQTLGWEASALLPGDPLTDLFFAQLSELPTLGLPIAREGWLEAYNHNLTDEPSRAWYWDGQPPAYSSDATPEDR